MIRRLTPPDAPWPGSLVRTDDDSNRQIVDAGLLADWDGWDAAPAGHVLGPLDVLRRIDGHDVLLPLCTERVDTLLTRRGAGLALRAGEIVTLAVSVLRGMAEVAERNRAPATGSWWLTDEGRPVFVDDADGAAGTAITDDLLVRLAADAPPRLAGALREAIDLVREPRALSVQLDKVEQLLFDVAVPEPLGTAPLPSLRRQHVAPEAAADATPDEAHRSWWAALLTSVDADLADAFSRATTRLWRRMRRPARRSRRRPWALAACLGAGVIAVGLMWPAPDPPAVADGPSASVSPEDSAVPAATPPVESITPAGPGGSDDAAGAASADLAVATTALLDRRRECLAAADDVCLAEVVEDPARTFPPGVVDAAAGERTVTLLDEFGGVAVLRVEATTGEGSAQLVVIVDSAGTWLLRDVHDVAQQ